MVCDTTNATNESNQAYYERSVDAGALELSERLVRQY